MKIMVNFEIQPLTLMKTSFIVFGPKQNFVFYPFSSKLQATCKNLSKLTESLVK